MLLCMQKINFIIHFFRKILQRNGKLVILRNLDMPAHKYLKWQCQFEESFNVYLLAKNQAQPSHFPGDIGKILKTCYFGYFGHGWSCTSKEIRSICRNIFVYLQAKKQLHYHFSGDMAKIGKILILDTLDKLALHTQNYSINL